MNDKLKRKWSLFADEKILAYGVVYREWNSQVLWRHDTGWGAEQVSTLHGLFELFPTATELNIEPILEPISKTTDIYAVDDIETLVIKEEE